MAATYSAAAVTSTPTVGLRLLKLKGSSVSQLSVSFKKFGVFTRPQPCSINSRRQMQSARATVEVEEASTTPSVAEEETPTVEAVAAQESSAEPQLAKSVPTASDSGRKRIRAQRRRVTVDLSTVEVGQSFTGKVKTVLTYGCFVDVGAATDGLVHISEISSGFVANVSDVVSVGQEVTVFVKSVDLENNRLSLTMNDPSAQPSVENSGNKGEDSRIPTGNRKVAGRGAGRRKSSVDDKPKHNLKKGQVLKGTVKNITKFGAFIQLEEGIEGLLRGSDIAEGSEDVPIENLLQLGQEVEVRVIELKNNKIGLSMKPEVDLTGVNSEYSSLGASNPFAEAFLRHSWVTADDLKPKEEETDVVVEPAAAAVVEEPAVAEEQVAAATEEVAAAAPIEEEVATPVAEAVVEEPVEEPAAKLAEEVKEVVEEVVTPAAEAVVDEIPAVQEEAAPVQEETPVAEAVAVVEEVAEVAEEVATPIEEEAPVAEAVVEEVANAVEDIASPVEEDVPVAEAVVEEVANTVEDVPSPVEEEAPVAEAAVEEVADAVENVAAPVEEEAPVAEAVVEGVADAVEEVTAAIEETVATVDEIVGEIAEEKTEEAPKTPVDEVKAEAEAEAAPAPAAAEVKPAEKASSGGISAGAVKALRDETGAGMMACKTALSDANGDLEKAREILRKKGLASAEKKASRIATEGLVHSYIHDGRIGILLEVNCETDFVSRGAEFRELVEDLAMQIAANPEVTVVSVDEIPAELIAKEREIELQREDLLTKPEAIRAKIVDGRIGKVLNKFALLEQPFIKDDKVLVKDLIKQVVAKIGENIQVRRFKRFNLGEGIEKKKSDFAAEVAAASAVKESAPKKEEKKEEPANSAEVKEAPKVAVSAKLVKELRESTGAGMMDCKKALAESNNDLEKATEYLRKKGLASAEKKAGRSASEGLVGSYIHDGRIGVLVEVNCETDFVSRGEKFQELVREMAMQVVACPQVSYVSVDDIPEEFTNKEKEIAFGQEDIKSKPEAVKEKIVAGRVAKRLGELALLEQAYIRNDKVLIKDLVKETVAVLGENIQIRRFERFVLGEGLEKKATDFAAEVAAVTQSA